MASEIVLHNVPEFDRAIVELSLKADLNARRFVTEGGILLASEAKRVFKARPGGQRTSKRTGRTYYSYKPPFQATPPQPTSRSGALQRSINLRRVYAADGGWKSETGAADSIQYAAYVEYGTPKMQKEPYMGKALESSKGALSALAERVWSEV